MVEYRKYIPHMNKPIRVKTSWGDTRLAVNNGSHYLFTDANHPMANVLLASYDIVSWEYINQEDADNLLFIRNTYQQRKEADEPLKKIKVTWIDRITYFFRRNK